MDSATLATWASVLIAVVALAVSILSGRRKDQEEKIEKVSKAGAEQEKALSALTARVSVIERDIQHLPDLTATHRMELTMGELKSEIAVMSEQLKSLAATSNRLQEFLLEQAQR